MILRFLIVILFAFVDITGLFAQLGSVRVQVYGGGNVQFIFNSMNDYKSGIILNNWTVIGVGVTEPAANFNGWTLSVSVDDNDLNPLDNSLTGSIVANMIPFSDIQVQATSMKSCVPVPCPVNLLASPWVNLVAQPASTVIANGTNDANCPCPPGILNTLTAPTDQINISYRCGVSPLGSMLSHAADIYSDNIYFDIAFQ